VGEKVVVGSSVAGGLRYRNTLFTMMMIIIFMFLIILFSSNKKLRMLIPARCLMVYLTSALNYSGRGYESKLAAEQHLKPHCQYPPCRQENVPLYTARGDEKAMSDRGRG
jgi:hypothetical protein